MHDGCGDDPPLVPELETTLAVGTPTTCTVPIAHDCAGSMLVENLEPAVGPQAIRPEVSQIAQPRGLAFASDGIVEGESLRDGIVVGRRVGSNLFKLANILRARRVCRRERPQRFDMFSPDVQKPRADRREQPLVEAGSVVVASKVRDRVREMRDAWAPSTMVLMPFARAASQIFRTGKIWPVRFGCGRSA